MRNKSKEEHLDIERMFRKKALSFIILASKSEYVLSAIEFFDKNFNLNDVDRGSHDDYRDYWASILIENINLLSQEKRNLVSISFVEPQSHEAGFRVLGDFLRYDIIAIKSTSSNFN